MNEYTNGAPEGDTPFDELRIVQAPGKCHCGCMQPVNGKRSFLQGHDAKLKSSLIQAGVDGVQVSVDSGGMLVSGDAITMADNYGFGHQVEAAIKGRLNKMSERNTRDATKRLRKQAQVELIANRKAERARQKAAKLAKAPMDLDAAATGDTDSHGGGTPATAKVGRWVYEGRISPDSKGFTYADAKGKVRTSTKFELV